VEDAKANKKIKRTAKSVINFAKRRKISAPFIRLLFWRYQCKLPVNSVLVIWGVIMGDWQYIEDHMEVTTRIDFPIL